MAHDRERGRRGRIRPLSRIRRLLGIGPPGLSPPESLSIDALRAVEPDLEEMAVGAWTIRYDAEATRAAYRTIARGAPEECGCDGCRYLVAHRDDAYPVEMRRLLDQLGVDVAKEAETYRVYDDGPYLYAGWYHAYGAVAEPWRRRGDANDWFVAWDKAVRLSPGSRVAFAPGANLPHGEFATTDRRVMTLEYETWVPFVPPGGRR